MLFPGRAQAYSSILWRCPWLHWDVDGFDAMEMARGWLGSDPSTIASGVRISVQFKIVDDFLYFFISNPTPAITNFKQQFNTQGGIGLENVKKRLELGYKKEDYNLRIEEKEKLFIVNLKILFYSYLDEILKQV